MPLITPRRRFLITAPLALLLPAGLLTYLGLETVRGIEIQYEDMAQEKVNEIVNRVRNTTLRLIRSDIQNPFRDVFTKEGIPQFPDHPPEDAFSFTLNAPLPSIKHIFVYGSDKTLYFFRRKQPSPEKEDEKEKQTSSVWTRIEIPRIEFANRLKSSIAPDITSLQNSYEEMTVPRDTNELINLPSSFNDFHSLRYPDELYPLDERRELAFYMITDIVPPKGKTFWIQAAGMSLDFDYINSHFFKNLLKELRLELEHPIAIEDNLLQIKVAEMMDASGRPMKESTKYWPAIFHNELFPHYKILFSTSIGEEVNQIAKYHKIFYYSLISVANLIMITSVIGALRNVAKELALSDMRSNFVARVSHELRTPLGLIRLYSETLEMGRTKNEEKRKEYLHAITKESERLTHMINNILNFSRIEANSQHYTFSEQSLEPVVIETVDTMRYHFERHGLQIKVSIEDRIPPIRCDNEALQQALYNLLNNAMKYTGKGKEIHVNTYTLNGEAVIDVTDHGIGIDPEQQDKIFNEFYRVDDPQVRETGGSGLGLAVVKHIVEAHHGHISVTSQPGKGSTFTIHLPISTESGNQGESG